VHDNFIKVKKQSLYKKLIRR